MTEAVQLAKVVQRLMRSGAYARALRLLDEVHPSDLAELVPLLRPREVGLLFTEVLPLQVTGEVLEEFLLPQPGHEQLLLLSRPSAVLFLRRRAAAAAARFLAR
mgnify:CR=1 FL=1